mmetsp:Transcript_23546/g.35558  ORF Transcript_23546/g.35558 Transcript_23546/m.35558 type:complete len:102 (-) Transcript_23546:123-428(-)
MQHNEGWKKNKEQLHYPAAVVLQLSMDGFARHCSCQTIAWPALRDQSITLHLATINKQGIGRTAESLDSACSNWHWQIQVQAIIKTKPGERCRNAANARCN